MIHFAYPLAIALLVLPFIVRVIFPAVKGLHGDALKVPFLKDIEKISIKSGSIWTMGNINNNKFSKLFWLLYIIWIFITLAIARPQWLGEPIRINKETRDILLIVDVSNSMLEPDFEIARQRIDRLTAVKKVVSEFIAKRSDDRVGLVLFGSRAYLQAPLTYDKQSVVEILWQTDAGMAGNSTAIGDALGLALKTLKDSKDKENKMIILLTDGESNDGALPLAQAIKLAGEEGIKTYTIGVGSDNSFMSSFFGVQLQSQSGLDEDSLKELANATKGTYFKAQDTRTLQNIYNRIDSLEPMSSESNFVQETNELFYYPLLIALLLSFILALVRRKLQ